MRYSRSKLSKCLWAVAQSPTIIVLMSGGVERRRFASTPRRTMKALSEGLASRPWLTVVMPIYRGERWLEAALQSIADDPDDGIEVLMIDSSPDTASIDIARRFSERLQLRVQQNSPLPSWPTKTNQAVKLARAEHVCWLHHDDLWLEGRAAAVRRWLAEAPKRFCISPLARSSALRAVLLGTWRCPFSVRWRDKTRGAA